MKKIGIIIFMVAVLIGVVFSNLFSFGKISGNLTNFKFVSSVKGSGNIAAEDRHLNGFTSIDVGGVSEVEVTAQQDFAVTVEADNHLLQYIDTSFNDGVLKISTSEKISSKNPIKIHISLPDIESVEASGISKVSVRELKNDSFEGSASGASKIYVAGETSRLNIDVSGASKFDG